MVMIGVTVLYYAFSEGCEEAAFDCRDRGTTQ